MDLGKYKAVTRTLSVDFDGEVINLTYRPNIYTLGLEREMRAANEERDAEALQLQLSEFIASWDLEENGQPLPLTPEGISKVPVLVLAAIDSAIGEAMLPSEEEKKGSSEPSPTLSTDSSEQVESSQNGSETSQSPTVSESVQQT